jgi:hypothetical protein
MNLELTLKQLTGTDFAFTSPPSKAEKSSPGPAHARDGPTATQQLLDSIARATDAIGGPRTLAGYQAARSQALTRKMGIVLGLDQPERVGYNSVPDIVIPRPETQLRTRPPAHLQAPSSGARTSWAFPGDDLMRARLLGGLPSPHAQTTRSDTKSVHKHAGEVYRRIPPSHFAPQALLSVRGTAPASPTRLLPEPARRFTRPLYLGKTPTSPFERSGTAVSEGTLPPTAMVEPRSHADKYGLAEQPATSAYAPGHHAKLAARATAAAIKANTQAIKALALA